MEVHHKHHLPKNWKEYLTEFIMLFTAVTLGFFAENYREHKIIEHRMEENYVALLQDLRQDSVRIKELQAGNVEERKGILTLLELLYKYQDGKLTMPAVQEGVMGIGRMPEYVTLFMNNTTFKNMQSSGMLSYVDNTQLRQELSFYYEVLFKKLIDNNNLYDDDGRKFYNEHFPIMQPTNNRVLDSLIGGDIQLSENYRTLSANKHFILSMPVAREILSDPHTLLKTESFYLRFCVYMHLLMTIEEQNKKLIKLLQE
jgi:hypothetical protein